MKRLILLTLLSFLAASCCALHVHGVVAPDIPRQTVAAQPTFPFENYNVYVFGDDRNPPVLLLHELPGFTPQAWKLAQTLADDGFVVYVPLLFGDAGRTVGRVTQLRVTLSPDWRGFREHRTAPITGMIERLATKIHARREVSLGVVGMCLTGNLPVALMGRLSFVKGAVVAQPSLPFCNTQDFALTQGDVDSAKKSGVKFILFRFTGDKISEGKRERFETEFDGQVDAQELPQPITDHSHSGFAHATLTSELFSDKDLKMIGDPDHCRYDNGKLLPASLTTACEYDKVRRYLHQRLDGNSK